MWQRLKSIGLVTGPGGLFETRLVTESGGLATNPPCDRRIEDYTTLHRGPRQGFVTEGPQQRFVTEGGLGGGFEIRLSLASKAQPGLVPLGAPARPMLLWADRLADGQELRLWDDMTNSQRSPCD